MAVPVVDVWQVRVVMDERRVPVRVRAGFDRRVLVVMAVLLVVDVRVLVLDAGQAATSSGMTPGRGGGTGAPRHAPTTVSSSGETVGVRSNGRS